MKSLFIVAIVFLLSLSAGVAQGPADSSAYNVDDAYQVYNAVIRHEESFRRAKGTLVIQQETVAICGDKSCGPNWVPSPPERCLSDEAAETFKDAIASFVRVNSYRWVLQRRFEIEKPYEFVSEKTIRAFFTPCCDWRPFYEKYPDSGGYMIFSAVGFNIDKTQAIVYSGSVYGGSGGRWGLHLLKKVDGNWSEVSGVRCVSG
jgi:hypothetical protein